MIKEFAFWGELWSAVRSGGSSSDRAVCPQNDVTTHAALALLDEAPRAVECERRAPSVWHGMPRRFYDIVSSTTPTTSVCTHRRRQQACQDNSCNGNSFHCSPRLCDTIFCSGCACGTTAASGFRIRDGLTCLMCRLRCTGQPAGCFPRREHGTRGPPCCGRIGLRLSRLLLCGSTPPPRC